MKPFKIINAGDLPSHFDARAAEARWADQWEQSKIHHSDPARPRAETFVVDTPPPTVSGSLHIGHVFSYTHPDVVARYKRMRGFNVFYAMGWDDNGLPTERRVQNYFHVRCDPRAPVDPDLPLEPASKEQIDKPPRLVSRPDFIRLCLELTQRDEKAFEALWRRVALSVDWRETYSTIDDRCRKLAQFSFLDLFEKGHAYSVEAPTMWDVDFQTAVAQAEVEDREVSSAFHRITFSIDGSPETFVIETTRPELLPACVAVTAHPNDARYTHLFGRRALTPLFSVPVPIFPSEMVDPEKGSGILMVCTFGDATDVQWWREQRLPLRQIIGRNGALVPVRYGEDGWESQRPEEANRFYSALVGKHVKPARQVISQELRQLGLSEEPRPITHAVKFYEKGDRPLEFISSRQWFVRLMNKKAELVARGEQVRWHPDFMGQRYRNWAENLQLDWCISRQRYFGVSFPVWYPLDEDGVADHDHPIMASHEMLPVDPTTDAPPGYAPAQRDTPGGFTAESDVFDTWFTSSLSPQIISGWLVDPDRHRRLFPADIRPQSHEIIRTWAFYTIVKAHLHEDSIPWSHALISGWILDPDRKKMSKSRGNVVTPIALVEEYSADAIRYWASCARLGTDTAYDDKIFKVGKRLVTKLFNAGKFVLSQSAEPAPIQVEIDRAFAARLRKLAESATTSLEEFEFARALQEVESFFWHDFTDAFLEIVKFRAREGSPADRGSAVASLRLALNVLLRLFAPVLPYITEEVWSWAFAEETGHPSIHRAPWPSDREFDDIGAPQDEGIFDLARAGFASLNKAKSLAGASAGRAVRRAELEGNAGTLARLGPVLGDIMAAARCADLQLRERADLEDGSFEVSSFELAEVDRS